MYLEFFLLQHSTFIIYINKTFYIMKETYLVVKPGFCGSDFDVISETVFNDIPTNVRNAHEVVYTTDSLIDAFDVREKNICRNNINGTELKWLNYPEHKPKNEERVLIIRKGYGNYWEPAVYNEDHECWDDADGDDYFCELDSVVKFLSIPEA